ncbi:acyltransferase family protein [Streptomyces virginiae]|uniref:acyltransferase family protein n=1 Tax=Streptomyces virginiae TaxID=1961 RepID=UPI002251BEC2|nr:acyltransferase [Streptomyces virginiae]MCX4956920.1 acyltransferase [Streptomyces virginiae]
MNLTKRLPARRAARGASEGGTPPATARLGWLDGLRGIAALSVALYHLALPFLWVPHGTRVPYYLDPGVFGVLLFFLVSGYIIPASLERRGDVRAFWVGRAFRIYPVVILTVVASLLLLPRAHTVIAGWSFEHGLLSLVGNGLMLQDLMGIPSVIGVMWTLTYEMVFYYFVTALFVMGRHRRSAPIAVGFAAVALVLGGWFSLGTLSVNLTSTRHLVVACATIVLMAMVCIMTGKPALTRTGALLLGGLGLLLITLNSRATGFETMMIFATMFSGTVLYRLEHGQIERTQALLSCAFVVACGFLTGYLYNRGAALSQTFSGSWMAWSFAYLAAWAVFAAGMLLRKRRFPRWLSWLGAISFSLYLLHNPLIHGMNRLLEGRAPIESWTGRLVQFGAFMAALLILSHLSYRLVELPFQNLGRRLLKAATRPRSRAPQAGTQAQAPEDVVDAEPGAEKVRATTP